MIVCVPELVYIPWVGCCQEGTPTGLGWRVAGVTLGTHLGSVDENNRYNTIWEAILRGSSKVLASLMYSTQV